MLGTVLQRIDQERLHTTNKLQKPKPEDKRLDFSKTKFILGI